MNWYATDLFSGCGGLTDGLKRAGFDVVSAVEIDPLAISTYLANHPEVRVIPRDITTVHADELSVGKSDIDLVAGCPPCQGFSRVRRRNRAKAAEDPRNALMGEYQRSLVEELNPAAVFLENVPGIEPRRTIPEVSGPPPRTPITALPGTFSNFPSMGCPSGGGEWSCWPARDSASRCPGEHARRGRFGRLLATSPPRQIVLIRCTNGSPSMTSRLSPASVPSRRTAAVGIPGQTRCGLQCHSSFDGFRDVYGRMAWDKPAPTTSPVVASMPVRAGSSILSRTEPSRYSRPPSSRHSDDVIISVWNGGAIPPPR